MTTLRKVLVVDDDPVVGRSFDRVLSTKGYAVITAANGDEALAKLAAEDYDVVYTDIRMPGMDGIEVARRVKAENPWLPVVIVTGYGSDSNVAKAKAAGVTRVLHKPLSPDVIEASAHEALLAKNAAVLTAYPPAPRVPAPGPLMEEKPENAAWLAAKTIAVGVAAPFVGLAYVLAFPLIGLASLVWTGLKALAARGDRIGRFARNVGLFLAAPFVGLAYTIALPFVGLGLIAWMGAKALLKRTDHD
jgi:CheY-like chemotaxis protein